MVGISAARAVALRSIEVARQLSLVAGVFVIAALLAATARTSYASPPTLSDAVVVSNFGVLFAGSVETFAVGSKNNAVPEFLIIGCKKGKPKTPTPCVDNTLLSDGNGAGGDAQSSLTGDIAVTVPLGIAGVFPAGLVEIWPFGAYGNSSATSILVGSPTTTGIDLDQGVGFEDPVDGINPFGDDILAVANFLPAVVDPPDIVIPLPPPLPPIVIGLCGAAPLPGFSLGTVTEYDATFLAPGLNFTTPLNNSPVNVAIGESSNATLGGCGTFLFGPTGVAFDTEGDLYVVNEAGAPALSYVTVYDPTAPFPYGGFGNALPISIIGFPDGGPTGGDLVDGVFVAVDSDFNVYVTDEATNSIVIFQPFENFNGLYYDGALVGTIHGGATRLNRPQGIAVSADGNLYVVNNNKNTLLEFEDAEDDDIDFLDIPPTVIIAGTKTGLNFPVGAALPQFPL